MPKSIVVAHQKPKWLKILISIFEYMPLQLISIHGKYLIFYWYKLWILGSNKMQ